MIFFFSNGQRLGRAQILCSLRSLSCYIYQAQMGIFCLIENLYCSPCSYNCTKYLHPLHGGMGVVPGAPSVTQFAVLVVLTTHSSHSAPLIADPAAAHT